ncbi:alpha-amylase [Streptomyces spinosus]|uniref:alpha-amylase n=1 Tax=Streptomyces spinosus TaxID=2872623 RepID=UPI001CEC6637|nr:alpha-amylase [Streptomyces spinosus]
MRSWTKRITTSAAGFTVLTFPLGPAAPALAQGEAPAPPAPACVAMYESWRYTTAANNCDDTVSVSVAYQDGAAGPCATLPPGAVTTVGEGYLGRHGHPDHLATCRPY